MMLEFYERAAECLRLARRTFSERDKELFEAMARAFAGERAFVGEREEKDSVDDLRRSSRRQISEATF